MDWVTIQSYTDEKKEKSNLMRIHDQKEMCAVPMTASVVFTSFTYAKHAHIGLK